MRKQKNSTKTVPLIKSIIERTDSLTHKNSQSAFIRRNSAAKLRSKSVSESDSMQSIKLDNDDVSIIVGNVNKNNNNNNNNNSNSNNNHHSNNVHHSNSENNLKALEGSSRKLKTGNSLAYRKTASIEMLRRHFYDPNVMGYDEETLYKLTQNQVQEFFPEHFSVSVIKTEKNLNQTKKIKAQNTRFEWKKFFSSIFCGACFNVKTFITVTLWMSFFVFLIDPCILGDEFFAINNGTTKHNRTYMALFGGTIHTITMRINNNNNNNNNNNSNKSNNKKGRVMDEQAKTVGHSNTTIRKTKSLPRITIHKTTPMVNQDRDHDNRCFVIKIYLTVIIFGIVLYLLLTLVYTYQLYVLWTSVPWYLLECITFACHAVLLCIMSIMAYIVLKNWKQLFALLLLIDSLLSLVIVLANLCFYFSGSTPLLQYYANLKTGYNPIDKIFAREKMESFVNWVKQQNHKTKRSSQNENKSPD